MPPFAGSNPAAPTRRTSTRSREAHPRLSCGTAAHGVATSRGGRGEPGQRSQLEKPVPRAQDGRIAAAGEGGRLPEGCALTDRTDHRSGDALAHADEAALLLGAAFGCAPTSGFTAPGFTASGFTAPGYSSAEAAAAAVFRFRSIARGVTLFRQGDACSRCWLVIEGAVALRTVGLEGQPVQLASYGPGEFVGAFPAPRQQPGELAATAPTRMLEAATIDLARLARSVPEIGAGLAALLARQHDKLIARMASQIALSAPGRVYAELLALAEGSGAGESGAAGSGGAGSGDTIRPAPVLAALALRVNTTRETASRAVSAAERRGLLRRDGGNLIIVSRERLAALVY